MTFLPVLNGLQLAAFTRSSHLGHDAYGHPVAQLRTRRHHLWSARSISWIVMAQLGAARPCSRSSPVVGVHGPWRPIEPGCSLRPRRPRLGPDHGHRRLVLRERRIVLVFMLTLSA